MRLVIMLDAHCQHVQENQNEYGNFESVKKVIEIVFIEQMTLK